MLPELQQLLHDRYELVSNHIIAIQKELESLEPERQHLLDLISIYSKKDHDFIETQRQRLFNAPTQIPTQTPTPTPKTPTPTTASIKPLKREYHFVSKKDKESALLQIFLDNDNKELSRTAINNALNDKLGVPLSASTVQRLIEQAVANNILDDTQDRHGTHRHKLNT